MPIKQKIVFSRLNKLTTHTHTNKHEQSNFVVVSTEAQICLFIWWLPISMQLNVLENQKKWRSLGLQMYSLGCVAIAVPVALETMFI